MVQLLNGFNPMDYDPTQGGGSWPLGKHPVMIESAEVKATQDNQSGYLQLNCKIIDGPNAGHVGAYRLNLYNQSAKAAEIAHKQLSAICHVTQTFQLGHDGTQVSALFGKPFVVEVGYQKGEEPGPNNPDAKGYTEIKRVFDMGGNEPGKNGSAQQAPQGFGGQQANGGFGGGQQQQPQQQPQQTAPQGGQAGGAQAWGGGGAPAGQGQPQQQPQGQQAGGWGGGQGAAQGQPQQPQQQPQGNGGGWAQGQGGAPAGGQQAPAWGQR